MAVVLGTLIVILSGKYDGHVESWALVAVGGVMGVLTASAGAVANLIGRRPYFLWSFPFVSMNAANSSRFTRFQVCAPLRDQRTPLGLIRMSPTLLPRSSMISWSTCLGRTNSFPGIYGPPSGSV